jgi:hypothetical protein
VVLEEVPEMRYRYEEIEQDLMRVKEVLMVHLHGPKADEALRHLEDALAKFRELDWDVIPQDESRY